MNLKTLIILSTLVYTTSASAPYCIYSFTKASFQNEFVDYTCKIDIDDQLDNLNEIWGLREGDDRHSDSDVKILTVVSKAKSLMNKFPAIFCNQFPNIEVIDMSEAAIESLVKNALRNCGNLEVLQFYKNKLLEIEENLLSDNPRLRELFLNYNNFITFPENSFQNLHLLENLDISANLIEFLPSNIFKSQKNLKLLKLDINKLTSLNPNWFKSLRNLQHLDLSENKIRELPENVFSPLQNLKTLLLNQNELQMISSYSFDQHPQLESVSLLKNQISSIDREFIENNQIKHLNMKGNVCSDDVKILRRDMQRKLKPCFENFKTRERHTSDEEPEQDTTTTAQPTTKRTRKTTPRTTTSTTTTTVPTTTTTSTTSTTPEPTTTTRRGRMTISARRTRPTTTTALPIKLKNLNENNCGELGIGIPLVINGEDFPPGSYPWTAVLVVDKKVHCGGVLISNSKVVTAGHCILTKTLREIKAEHIRVVLGAHDLIEINEVHRRVFGVEKIYVHKNWNQFKSRFDSDIAVLILKEEVTYNLQIRPICLPLPNSPVTKINEGTIVGYGKTEDKSQEYSNIPKRADTPIHDLTTCILKFPNIQQIADHTTFCGGHANGTGACTGDSGSGLFVRLEKVFYLRGIVSASLAGAEYGCSVESYSLFTDITKFLSWISNIEVDNISVRFGSPKLFVPPWLTTTPRTREYADFYDNRPVW